MHKYVSAECVIPISAQQKQGHISSGGSADHLLQQQQQQRSGRSQTTEARLFAKYDVSTTSYHLITSRIDLHLCDDTPTDKGKLCIWVQGAETNYRDTPLCQI